MQSEVQTLFGLCGRILILLKADVFGILRSKLLKLRVIFMPMLKFKTGNGRRIFLWFDNRHSFGPLMDIFSKKLMMETDFPRSFKIFAIIKEGDWDWPASRSLEMTALQVSLCGHIL